MAFVLLLGGGIGCIPLLLLFVDYRKRGQIHKPFLYIAAFGLTFTMVLPFLLKSLGIWIALAAPIVLFIMVLVTRRPTRS
ncbi:MAG: hypothetical protein IPK70_06025 [Flavobacteriales bacterium]|nr:hypothetical protein [Flavobacteriales bacterium]